MSGGTAWTWPRRCGWCLLLLGWAAAGSAGEVTQAGADAVIAPDSATRPLWEAGIGGVAGALADYPASDRYQVRGLPVPYFVYRGNFLRADQAGTRLHAGDGDLEWELSGGGNLSSDSTGGARAGMPNLDYLLELGPKAKVTVARLSAQSRVLIDLPIRAAASTNFSTRFDARGWVFAPDILYEDRAFLGTAWNTRVSLGVEAATRAFQNYYYTVAPEFARPGRPAYQARAGYLGAELLLAAFKPVTRRFSVFVSLELDSYRGAANEDSPLYRTAGGGAFALGFAYSLAESQESASPRYR